MNTPIRRLQFGWKSILTLLCIGLPVACKEDSPITTPQEVTDGELQLTILTTGSEPDADGYSIQVDGVTVARVEASKSLSLRLRPGDHQIELGDVAPNCQLNGSAVRTVKIVVGGKAGVTFALDCLRFGELEVITSTTGVSQDADGYVLTIDGTVRGPLSLQDDMHLPLMRPGFYTVGLTSVVTNCSVAGGSSRIANVPEAGTAVVTFDVSCVPRPDDTPGEKLAVAVQEPASAVSTIVLMEPDGTGAVPLLPDAPFAYTPDFSRDGTHVLFLKSVGGSMTLSLVDRVTRVETNMPAPGFTRAVWSPDGTSILVARNGRLSLLNADGTNLRDLTVGPNDQDPYWSPDGNRIAFSRNNHVYLMNRDGSGLQTVGPDLRLAGPFSPDGRFLVVNQLETDPNSCYWYYYYYGCSPAPSDLKLLDLQTGEESALTQTQFRPEWSPAWSSDGQWVYFISAPTGNPDIFKHSVSSSAQIQVTNSPSRENWVSVATVTTPSQVPVARVRRP